jgi:DNA invertase Pin-like site-specific DNA recombinase
LQIGVALLKAAKCERIYRDQAPGGRWDRPELQRLLDQLRKGDVLVVWRLDRLSRSLRDVLTIMERLAETKAGFRSLTEAIDTTTPAGRMMIQMVGSFAEFERAMLAGTHEDWCGDGPPRRADWRATAKADYPTAV